MSYYLGEIAILLVEAGFEEVQFCISEHVVYAGNDVSIRYIEEDDMFSVKKGNDVYSFEADVPVEEIVDWVKEELVVLK